MRVALSLRQIAAALRMKRQTSGEVIGVLARTLDHPERWSLLRPDGSVSNRFARAQTRQDVAKVLASQGLTLRDDNTVVRQ
jgi:hypothetical protein